MKKIQSPVLYGLLLLSFATGLNCNDRKTEDVCLPSPERKITSVIRDNGTATVYSYQQIGDSCEIISAEKNSDGAEKHYVWNPVHPYFQYIIEIYDERFTFPQFQSMYELGKPCGLVRSYFPKVEWYQWNSQYVMAPWEGGNHSYVFTPDGYMEERLITSSDGDTFNELYTWENGNLVASVTKNLGSRIYEYYPDRFNTLGNEYTGRSFLGKSSVNLIKRELRFSDTGNTILNYEYEFDEDCYVTKRIITTTDEEGNVKDVSWSIYTYE